MIAFKKVLLILNSNIESNQTYLWMPPSYFISILLLERVHQKNLILINLNLNLN